MQFLLMPPLYTRTYHCHLQTHLGALFKLELSFYSTWL